MAWTKVEWNCGHTGSMQLYGKASGKQARVAFEARKRCMACWLVDWWEKTYDKKNTDLTNVEFLSMDYVDVQLFPKSVIYCDIPYKTGGGRFVTGRFDRDRFFKWAKEKAKEGHKVFISEYKENIVDLKDLKIVFELNHRRGLHTKNVSQYTTEVLISPIVRKEKK